MKPWLPCIAFLISVGTYSKRQYDGDFGKIFIEQKLDFLPDCSSNRDGFTNIGNLLHQAHVPIIDHIPGQR